MWLTPIVHEGKRPLFPTKRNKNTHGHKQEHLNHTETYVKQPHSYRQRMSGVCRAAHKPRAQAIPHTPLTWMNKMHDKKRVDRISSKLNMRMSAKEVFDSEESLERSSVLVPISCPRPIRLSSSTSQSTSSIFHEQRFHLLALCSHGFPLDLECLQIFRSLKFPESAEVPSKRSNHIRTVDRATRHMWPDSRMSIVRHVHHWVKHNR